MIKILPILFGLLTGALLTITAAEVEKKKAAPLTAGERAAADLAWKEVLEATKPPPLPAEWASKEPTEEDREKFQQDIGKAALNAADKAKAFYAKYPSHPQAEEAQKREKKMLETALRFGQIEANERLIDHPQLTVEEKIAVRMNQVNANALKQREKGLTAVLGEFEKGLREVIKDHPERSDLYGQFLMLAENSTPEKAKELLKEIIASKADEQLKARATAALKRMDAVGHPFEMQFTAMDGREIDVQKMKGKVILIDFWATWCGPCIAELPNVKRVYQKYHDKGFEILGISFDKNKGQLTNFVSQNDMTWPQYFDGQGWGNKFGLEFNITSIPAMWLVDKNGILRDMNAREDLAEKIEKYLAEK